MFRYLGIIGLLFLTTQFSFAQDTQLSIPKVNKVFQSLLNSLIVNDDFLQELSLKFDPKYTNVDEAKIKLSGRATVYSTAWYSEPSSLTLEVGLDNEKKGDKNILSVIGGATLETDSLAFARFAANEAAKSLRRKEKLSEIETEVLALLDGADKIENLRELEFTLGQIQILALKEATLVIKENLTQIQEEQAKPVDQQDPILIANLVKLAAEAVRDQEAILKAKIAPIKKSGEWVGLRVQYENNEETDIDSNSNFNFSQFDLEIKADRVKAKVKMTLGPKAWDFYQERKESIVSGLLYIQNAKGEELDSIREGMRGYMEFVKGLLKSK